jgi:hypothetical protein
LVETAISYSVLGLDYLQPQIKMTLKEIVMALVQVEMEGLKQARWRNSMRSIFVVCKHALFAWWW